MNRFSSRRLYVESLETRQVLTSLAPLASEIAASEPEAEQVSTVKESSEAADSSPQDGDSCCLAIEKVELVNEKLERH